MAGSGLWQYHLQHVIWSGESAIVYKGVDAHNRGVAVKMLRAELARSRRRVRQIEEEFRTVQRLRHPNIIRALGYFRARPQPCVVFEYFRGRNLKRRILAKEKLVQEVAFEVIRQAAQALAHCHHQGIIHRDVKPENLLLASDGALRLIDFALAMEWRRGWWSRLAQRRARISGTRSYIAPEVIQRQHLTPAADIYSFGATIYELLAARPPFISPDRDEVLRKHLREPPTYLRNFRADVSEEMDKLVMAMLDKRPEKRPTIDQIVSRLSTLSVFA